MLYSLFHFLYSKGGTTPSGRTDMDEEMLAAEAVFSHCAEDAEKEILAAWIELFLSDDLPADTQLSLKFGKKWCREGSGPGHHVRELVRVVSRDYEVPRARLAEELAKLFLSAENAPQK